MTFLIETKTTDIAEAMDIGDHNYTVEMVPLTLPDGTTVWDKNAVVRTDTGKYLGTVGKDYKPVQPVQVYEMAYYLLENVPGAEITGVVNMHGGSTFGMNFSLGQIEPISGDIVEMNFLLLASHNGRYGILGRAISSRWFCTNQVPSSTKMFNLKHTRFVDNRLDTAMKMLAHYNQELSGFNQKMKMLAGYRMPIKTQLEWFEGLFPALQENASQRTLTTRENISSSFMELVEAGRGTAHPGVRGTGWGAFNALTEYVNHVRPTRVREGKDPDEVRFESITKGDGNNLMQRGMSSLIDLAKHEPSNRYV